MGKTVCLRMLGFVFLAILFTSAPYVIASGQGEDSIGNQTGTAKAQFDKAYSNWHTFCDKPEIMLSSLSSTYVENKPFQAIIDLGSPALPFIVDKIEEDKTNRWQEGDFFLWYAIRGIKGVDLEHKVGITGGEQGVAEEYIKWWQENKETWAKENIQ